MNIAAPEAKANQGQPAARIDGRLKVTGGARYPSDLPFNNPAYAYLVTSSIARGKIRRIDTMSAKAVPGVIDILTHENASAVKGSKFFAAGGTSSTSIVPLASSKIWHDGQIVAMVLAESYEAAREAGYRVQIDYEHHAPSAGFDSKGSETVALAKVSKTHEDPKANDAKAAFAASEVTIDAEYGTPTQHHNPMELFTTTCVWSGDELTVHEPSQFVYGLKNGVAEQLGLDPNRVRAVSHYIGGAFGSKGSLTPRTALVAFAAKKLNRPVKLVATRQQGFTITTYRAETRQRVRLGASADGRIKSFEHEGWEVTSRPDDYAVAGTDTTTRMYAYGAVASRVSIVHADRNTPGFMRSPPETPYMFGLESAIDELAAKLKIDPVELRRINDTKVDPVSGKPYSSRSLMQCYDEAARSFGWARRKPEPGSMRDGDWLIGWGCATATYPTHAAPAAVRVRLAADGQVRVQVAAHDVGTGTYTVVGQLAARGLGVELDAVEVMLGDTLLPAAPVSGGSNVTASVGSVVMKACEAIRAKLVAAATAPNGAFAGRAPAELLLRDGGVAAADGAPVKFDVIFGQMATASIEEYAEWFPAGQSPKDVKALYAGKSMLTGGSKGDKLKFAFGAEFVEVRINRRTREIRVPRIVGAFAAGHIVNPRTARSQLLGGMIWGISSALHEATEIDERAARYVNNDLAEYLIPVNADIDQLEVIFVPEVDTDVNPAGIKGLGELGNVGTAAAVANAVWHATGMRIRQLPIRLENLL